MKSVYILYNNTFNILLVIKGEYWISWEISPPVALLPYKGPRDFPDRYICLFALSVTHEAATGGLIP